STGILVIGFQAPAICRSAPGRKSILSESVFSIQKIAGRRSIGVGAPFCTNSIGRRSNLRRPHQITDPPLAGKLRQCKSAWNAALQQKRPSLLRRQCAKRDTSVTVAAIQTAQLSACLQPSWIRTAGTSLKRGTAIV